MELCKLGYGLIHMYRFITLAEAGVFSINEQSLVTRDQPYLFATIFKHFIYVCFQLLIFMNKNQLKLH